MNEPARYQIRVAEHLDEHWTRWFDDVEIIHAERGGTIFRGTIADQPALYGLLGKIRDLGLTLISVERGIEKGEHQNDSN